MKKQIAEKVIHSQPKQEKLLVLPDYLVAFVISSHLEVIQHWIETGLERS
jgi:hypothetical protein